MTRVPEYNLNNSHRIPTPSPDEVIRPEFRTGGARVVAPARKSPIVMGSYEMSKKLTKNHVAAAEVTKPKVQMKPLATPQKPLPAFAMSPTKHKSFDMRLCSWCGGRLTSAQVEGIHERCSEQRDRARG